MNDEIVRSKTYTVKDVSRFLLVSEQLAERLIREQTIRSLRVGREWRVTGAALLDYLGLAIAHTPERLQLVDELNTEIETLGREQKYHTGANKGVLLNQIINNEADDGSLRRIIAHVKKHREMLEERRKSSKSGTGAVDNTSNYDPSKPIRLEEWNE